MEKNIISAITRRFLSRRFPEETEAKVQKWIISDKDATEKEQASLEYWNELETETNSDTDSALKRVKQRIAKYDNQTRLRPFYQKIARIAAILIPALMIAGGYLYYTSDQNEWLEISAAFGENKHLTLPDSSQIWLNAGTTIKYPEKFAGDRRLVKLNGEAYFQVTGNREKPFIVQTEQLSVKVLGTRFNVKAYAGDERATTSLTSGKVEVYTKSADRRILKPNEQLTYNIKTSAINVEEIQPDATNAWLAGQLIFVNSSFREIKQTLERHFNVTIAGNLSDAEQKLYTVKFLRGENLTEILNILQDVVGFTFQQQGTNVTIRKLQP